LVTLGEETNLGRITGVRGRGRIYTVPKSRYLHIAYYYRGKEKRESSGSTDLKVAERLLRRRLQEIGAAQIGARPFVGPQQERQTVDDLLKDYQRDSEIHQRKSLPQLRSRLKHLRAFFGLDRAIAVTPDRIRLYIASRQRAGAANATVNRELEVVQRAFALAVEARTLGAAPKVPSLPEHNARQGFFERGEFEAVLQHLGDQDLKDHLAWSYVTGMRPGEIRGLTWADLDRETWTLRLHAKDAKSGYGRAIPLEGPLRAIIARRIQARHLACPFIFHRKGRRVGEFRKVWKRASRDAGLTGKIPYDLRRTAVRNMVRAGVDPAIAMKISGHRTRAVFDRYNIIDERDLREAVRKTSSYMESLPTMPTVMPIRSAARSANLG
jgi:integrase